MAGRTGPRRKALAVRIDDPERERIAELARQHGLLMGNGEPNLSEMARRMLAETSDIEGEGEGRRVKIEMHGLLPAGRTVVGDLDLQEVADLASTALGLRVDGITVHLGTAAEDA